MFPLFPIDSFQLSGFLRPLLCHSSHLRDSSHSILYQKLVCAAVCIWFYTQIYFALFSENGTKKRRKKKGSVASSRAHIHRLCFFLFLCLYLLNEHVWGLVFNLCPLGSSCVGPSTSRASCVSLNEGLCLLCVCVCCLRYRRERLCMFIGVRGRALTSLLSATYRPLRGLAECTKDATTSVGSLMCRIDMLSLPFLPLYFFSRPPLPPVSASRYLCLVYLFARCCAHSSLYFVQNGYSKNRTWMQAL